MQELLELGRNQEEETQDRKETHHGRVNEGDPMLNLTGNGFCKNCGDWKEEQEEEGETQRRPFCCRTRKICLPDYTTLFQAATMDGRTVFTLAEVASHDNRNDCWLIIEDKVYDVTKFLEDHPGGDEVLLSSTGKDATKDFLDVGHSSAASAMMEEFYVGDIDSSIIPAKGEYIPPKQPLYNQDKTVEFIIKVLQFLAPLVILGLAFGIHIYTKTT